MENKFGHPTFLIQIEKNRNYVQNKVLRRIIDLMTGSSTIQQFRIVKYNFPSKINIYSFKKT